MREGLELLLNSCAWQAQEKYAQQRLGSIVIYSREKLRAAGMAPKDGVSYSSKLAHTPTEQEANR